MSSQVPEFAGNPVRFPYSQAIPTSIPSECSDTEPCVTATAFVWTVSDEVNFECQAGRLRLLRAPATTEIAMTGITALA